MRQLDPHDLSWALRILPRELKVLMEEAGERIVLGGGFLRSSVSGERPNDIDLFCKSPEDAFHYATLLAGLKNILVTDNAYSIRKVGGFFVQFIHRWTYETPAQILDSFDFTVACSAVWFEKWCDHKDSVMPMTQQGGSFICTRCNLMWLKNFEPITDFGKWTSLIDDNFYSDLAAKRLVYRSPQRNEDAGGSMLRVLKFYQKGFRIPLDSLGAVIARMADAVDLKCIEVLPDFDTPSDLGKTTEERWAKVLTGLLREVDPLIDPTHAAHLPSQKEAA